MASEVRQAWRELSKAIAEAEAAGEKWLKFNKDGGERAGRTSALDLGCRFSCIYPSIQKLKALKPHKFLCNGSRLLLNLAPTLSDIAQTVLEWDFSFERANNSAIRPANELHMDATDIFAILNGWIGILTELCSGQKHDLPPPQTLFRLCATCRHFPRLLVLAMKYASDFRSLSANDPTKYMPARHVCSYAMTGAASFLRLRRVLLNLPESCAREVAAIGQTSLSKENLMDVALQMADFYMDCRNGAGSTEGEIIHQETLISSLASLYSTIFNSSSPAPDFGRAFAEQSLQRNSNFPKLLLHGMTNLKGLKEEVSLDVIDDLHGFARSYFSVLADFAQDYQFSQQFIPLLLQNMQDLQKLCGGFKAAWTQTDGGNLDSNYAFGALLGSMYCLRFVLTVSHSASIVAHSPVEAAGVFMDALLNLRDNARLIAPFETIERLNDVNYDYPAFFGCLDVEKLLRALASAIASGHFYFESLASFFLPISECFVHSLISARFCGEMMVNIQRFAHTWPSAYACSTAAPSEDSLGSHPVWVPDRIESSGLDFIRTFTIILFTKDSEVRREQWRLNFAEMISSVIDLMLECEFVSLTSGQGRSILETAKGKEIAAAILMVLWVLEESQRLDLKECSVQFSTCLVTRVERMARALEYPDAILSGHEDVYKQLDQVLEGPETEAEKSQLHSAALRLKEHLTAPKGRSDAAEKLRAEALAQLPCAYLGCTTLWNAADERKMGKRCSGCSVLRYCSIECQTKDWKEHKKACKLLKAERQG